LNDTFCYLCSPIHTSCQNGRKRFLHDPTREPVRLQIRYPEDKIFLIAARHIVNGTYYDFEQLDELAQKLRDKGVTVHRPVYNRLQSIGINNLTECKTWIEQESVKTNIYGTCPEGFVIYFDNIPTMKMKNKDYHNTHQLRTGSLLFLRNTCITAFFQGTLDDIMGHLRPSLLLFVAELKAKFQLFLDHYTKIASQIRETVHTQLEPIPQSERDKKKWHLFAQELQSGKYHFEGKYNLNGFLFSQKKIILEGNIDSNHFVIWLKQNHIHFHEFWKQSEIPEIVDAEKIQEKVVLPLKE